MKKTPREILMQRHQAAELKLDTIRKDFLAGRTGVNLSAKDRLASANLERAAASPIAPARVEAKDEFAATAPSIVKPSFNFSLVASRFWQELILPCRAVWLGMATVWVVVLALHVAMHLPVAGEPQMAAIHSSPPNAEMSRALKEQKLLLAQLLEPVASPAAKPGAPAPRSELRQEEFIA